MAGQRNVEFTKMQGTGNDFILLDGIGGKIPDWDFRREAVWMCDRRLGIGGDGVMLVRELEGKPVMELYNSDGSVAAMCGNGIRCLARFIWDRGYFEKRSTEVLTGSGVRVVTPCEAGVKVDLGEPVLYGEKEIFVGGERFFANGASMGNPHAVMYVEDLDRFAFERFGPLFQEHSEYPGGVNAEFVQVEDACHVRVKVWERGCGPTLACGTGGGAVAAVSMEKGIVGKSVWVKLPGGTLFYERENGRILMTGPAEYSFTGKWEKKDDDEMA